MCKKHQKKIIKKKNKKQTLKKTKIHCEKSTNDYKDPIQQKINLKKNVNKFGRKRKRRKYFRK